VRLTVSFSIMWKQLLIRTSRLSVSSPSPSASILHTHHKRYSSTTASTIDASKKYPTISELFTKSLTCSRLEYKNKKVFLIGDKGSDPYSYSRIEYTVKTLKPKMVLLESENPFLGRDNNQYNPKDASWRRPNPTGTLILDSYQNMHAADYPNLASYLDNYTPDNKQSHMISLRQLCELQDGVSLHYVGDDLADMMQRKSKAGQLEELTVQFREQFLREAKRNKEQRDKEKRTHGISQSQSFFGSMEGLDEKEQREQIELSRLVVDDLNNLCTYFPNDQLMNAVQFKQMMNDCNHLKTIDDYELFAEKSLARNAVLNETIRSLEMDYEANARDFWTAMKLLVVNRDRLLLRIITEQCEEMIRNGDEGVILGVVNIMHIHGIETLWKSAKFWKDEQVTREYVNEMADRGRIKEELEKANAPWFGKSDPARDTDVNDSTRF